jgi:hypothetical protein
MGKMDGSKLGKVILSLLILGVGCLFGSCSDVEISFFESSNTPPEVWDPQVIIEDTRSDGSDGIWWSQYINLGVWPDAWFINQYERPFTSGDMVYLPYIDIVEVGIKKTKEWTLFEITAAAPSELEQVYISVEVDLDLDNRSDLLILTRAVEEEAWNDLQITILTDQDNDAGGYKPRLAEPYHPSWTGFDEPLGEDLSQAVFVRRSPNEDNVYQIAVSNRFLDSDQFAWRAWLEGEIFHPGWYDYNDRYSFEEAGSPYTYSEVFPIQEISAMDNTCVHLFGAVLSQASPGYCGTVIESESNLQIPPDDQFSNGDSDGPINILLPNPSPGEDGGTVTPTPFKLTFNPGYYLQPTATPNPLQADFPFLVLNPTPEPTGNVVEVIIPTPAVAEAVIPTPIIAQAVVPTPLVLEVAVPTPTDLFDPYAGSTPPPTDLFDPYQGSSPTPFLINPGWFRLKTPTPY